MSATGPLVFFGGPCHGGGGSLWSTDTSVYALDIHGSAHAVNMPVYMRERTGSRPVGTAGAGDRWRRKEYTRNTLEIGNALPTAVDGSIENEIAARRTVGGPRIGTYLLINLYRLFRAARTNRNTDVEAEERKKKKMKPFSLFSVENSRVCARTASSSFTLESIRSSGQSVWDLLVHGKSMKRALILFITRDN